MDIFTPIQTFIQNLETTLIAISGSVAVIGVMGLGLMYLGSSWPLIGDWRRDNPRAFSQVTWGLLILVFAAGGGVLGLLGM
jgi:phage-related minor tail protein